MKKAFIWIIVLITAIAAVATGIVIGTVNRTAASKKDLQKPANEITDTGEDLHNNTQNDIKKITAEEVKSVLLGTTSFEESEARLKNLKWKYLGQLLDSSMTTRYLYVIEGDEGLIVVMSPIINLYDMSFRIDFEDSTYLITEEGTVNAKTKEAPDAQTLAKLNNTLFFKVEVKNNISEEALLKDYGNTWYFETYDQYIAEKSNTKTGTDHVPEEPTPSPVP